MNVKTDGWMDGWMYVWMDGWMDRRNCEEGKHLQVSSIKHCLLKVGQK